MRHIPLPTQKARERSWREFQRAIDPLGRVRALPLRKTPLKRRATPAGV